MPPMKIAFFCLHLICAWRVARPQSALLIFYFCVRSNVPEDAVHAGQLVSGADDWVVVKGESMEERDAAALAQDLVVRRRKQAVGQAIPKKVAFFFLFSQL